MKAVRIMGTNLMRSMKAVRCWILIHRSGCLAANSQPLRGVHGVEVKRYINDGSVNSDSKILKSFPFGDRQKGKGSWWDVSTEWKVVASFVFAVTSYFLNSRNERIQLKRDLKLNRIQSQIKDLYGPLYGNRLANDTSYRAVMRNHHELNKYLHEARKNKDAEMLHRWRSYVWNVLYPLDKAAVDMILNNAHLIVNGDFPEEFEQLLMHTAKMEFLMQLWKNDDGTLESTKSYDEEDYLESNNASGLVFRTRILSHVKQKYDELREEKNKISLDIASDKRSDNIFAVVFKSMVRQEE